MPLETGAVGKGYALWLMPGEPLFNRLSAEILRLSQELATPLFEPHVTLLGGITLPEEEVLARAIALAGALKPFQIELGEIGYLDEYFRCLFVRVVPGDHILKAHTAGMQIFGQPGGQPYEPHISLVYGKLGIERKRTIAAGRTSLTGQVFNVKSLAVYQVRGVPSDWKLIKSLEIT